MASRDNLVVRRLDLSIMTMIFVGLNFLGLIFVVVIVHKNREASRKSNTMQIQGQSLIHS